MCIESRDLLSSADMHHRRPTRRTRPKKVSIDRWISICQWLREPTAYIHLFTHRLDAVEEKHSDFGFDYYATRAALFRYSAATFNAHESIWIPSIVATKRVIQVRI